MFVFQTWTSSKYEEGIRSPIGFRDNGIVCDSTGSTSSWIGLQQDNSELTQMGFEHVFDIRTGTGEYCKFYENYPANPILYACGEPVNDVDNFFEIQQYYSGQGSWYDRFDCYTAGGYGSNCYLKYGSQPAYSSPFAVAAGEVHYACTDNLMGSVSDPERYGSNSYPLEVDNTSGWLQRSWGPVQYPSSPQCATVDYNGDQVSQGFRSWDTRYP